MENSADVLTLRQAHSNFRLFRKARMSYPNYQPYQYPNYPNVQQNNSLEFFHGSKFKEKSVIY